MPPNAKVVIVENIEMMIGYIRRELERGGHTVLHTAQATEEALGLVAQIPELQKQHGGVVFTLDGNLDGRGRDAGFENDAEYILNAMRNACANVLTVGLGSDSIEGVTVDLGKADLYQVAKVIDGL